MNKSIAIIIAILTATVTSTAFAHPGHDTAIGVVAGLMHPLAGVDHLMFLVGVGVFLAIASERSPLVGGVAVLAALSGGALLGVAGLPLPAVEWFIGTSVLLAGAALAWAPSLRSVWVLAVAVLFALFHGFAHGVEASAPRGAFVAGFLLTSLIVMAVSALAARLYVRRTAVRVAIGAAVATSGLTLVARLLLA